MQQQHYLHKYPSGLVVLFCGLFGCANDYMGAPDFKSFLPTTFSCTFACVSSAPFPYFCPEKDLNSLYDRTALINTRHQTTPRTYTPCSAYHWFHHHTCALGRKRFTAGMCTSARFLCFQTPSPSVSSAFYRIPTLSTYLSKSPLFRLFLSSNHIFCLFDKSNRNAYRMDIRFSLTGIKLNTDKLTKFTKKKSTNFFFLFEN